MATYVQSSLYIRKLYPQEKPKLWVILKGMRYYESKGQVCLMRRMTSTLGFESYHAVIVNILLLFKKGKRSQRLNESFKIHILQFQTNIKGVSLLHTT